MKLKLDDHVLAEVDRDICAYLLEWSNGDLSGLTTSYTKSSLRTPKNSQLTEVKVAIELTFLSKISTIQKGNPT